MATKNFSALLTIGGAVDGSLGAAVSKVRGQIDSLGSTMKESNAGQRSIKALVGAQGRVDDSRTNVRDEMKKLADLQGQTVWVSSSEDLNQLNKEIAKQKERVDEARSALEKHVVALDNARDACKAAGVDTGHLSEENERLARSADEAKKKITALKDASGSVQRDIAALGASLGRLKIAGVAAAASTAALGAAIWKTAHGFFEFADEAQDTADALGMTMMQFQALEYAGSRVGVTNEKMASGLNAFNNKLGEAASGAKGASTAFDALGLDAVTLQMMDAEQRMEVLADVFKNYDGPVSKAALANDLFGKGGYKMANVLNQGAAGLRKMREEGKNTGYFISPKQQEIAQKFDDALGQLGATVQGIRNQFGAALLPTITRVFDFLSRHALIVKAAFIGLGVAIGSVALVSLVKFGIEAKRTIVILQSLATKIALLNALQAGGSATQSGGILGKLGGVVKALIPGITTLGTTLLPSLSAGFAALGAAIMATPIGWIIGGIALLGLAIVGIIKFWQPIKSFFKGFGQGIAEAFAPVMPLFDWMGSVVGQMAGLFGDLLRPIEFSAEALGECTNAGKVFGQVITTALFPPLEIIKGISWGIDKISGFFGKGKNQKGSTASISSTGIDNPLGNAAADKRVPTLGETTATSAVNTKAAIDNPLGSTVSNSGSQAVGDSVRSERGTPAIDPSSSAVRTQVHQNNTISININPQPGQSAEEIARRTADEIERRTAREQRAALYDTTAAYAY